MLIIPYAFPPVMADGEVFARQNYIDMLADLSDDRGTVKVLTGMRGVGKTTLLREFARRLIDDCSSERDVVTFDFDSVENYDVRTSEDLKLRITRAIEKRDDPCVFLDEVQKIPGWDDALSEIMIGDEAEFFLSASDDSVMYPKNDDVRRSLREIRVHPLSLPEFMAYNRLKNRDRAMSQYLKYGGMPFIRTFMTEDEIFALLHGKLCESILLDGLTYTSRLDPDTALDIAEHVLDTAGRPMDSEDIVSASGKRFGYAGRALRSMAGTYVAYEADGRSFVDRLKKTRMVYYASDLGIRNCIKGVSRDAKRQAENAVFIELKRRGYGVKVEEYAGNTAFVADRGGRKVRYFVSEREVESPRPGKKVRFIRPDEDIDTVRITPDGTSGKTSVGLGDFLMGAEPRRDGSGSPPEKYRKRSLRARRTAVCCRRKDRPGDTDGTPRIILPFRP